MLLRLELPGLSKLEYNIEDLKERRRCSKERISAQGCYLCDKFPKVFLFRIGLVSHRRTHDHKGE